jgi:hypothetical protein
MLVQIRVLEIARRVCGRIRADAAATSRIDDGAFNGLSTQESDSED